MRKDYFDENQSVMEALEKEASMDDYVDEEDLLALEQEQQMIDLMEEQALLEEWEEQAVIDAYIEQQLIEQSLLEQTDEETQIEYVDQQQIDEDEQILVNSYHQNQLSDKTTDDGKVNTKEETDEESDDEPDEGVPINIVAHRQVKLLMRQHNHLDIYVKKEDVSISCFGLTRLKYKLNYNGWQWILNYLETGCYEDFGVNPSEVSNIDCESYVKELIELGCNIARVPFLRETEAYIEICAFFRYGKLFFSIRRNDDFMNYLINKGL